MTMNPGTVDVAVFPPISVHDWTLDTLPDRIAEVRQLYVDTLADWPVDELPGAGVYRREKKAAPTKTPRKAAKKPAKATAAKKAQPKTSASKVTKAQPGTPRPRGRS
jgi:putative phosphoserine phosphatase/1-acylglycerol-3-phosphate O-acyltransferase